MSKKFTEEFFQWADAHQISREDIAQETGNSKQTISKWRSIGIPKGKEFGLRSFMERHLRTDTEEIRHRMLLEPTHAQFNRWNRAALAANKQSRIGLLKASKKWPQNITGSRQLRILPDTIKRPAITIQQTMEKPTANSS
jgi:hypothetical protein